MPRELERLEDPYGFRRLLSNTTPEVSVRADPGFHATIREVHDGAASAARIHASAHTALRPVSSVSTGSSPTSVCVYLMDGTGALVQDGQERTLRAGSVWWFRTDLNYTLSFPDPVRMVAVAVPAERSQRLAEHLRSGHLPATDPVAASLGPTLERLEDAYGSLSPMTRHRFTEHLLDTVDTIWMHAAELDGRPTLVAQAMSVIESRLADPELDPSHIARALHVSVRSLHAAFAEVGMSIAATIRSSRLEHCRKDLADPLLSHRAVGAIGAAWGFASPSHFTSLFRARFGMTPTAYRKAQPTLVG